MIVAVVVLIYATVKFFHLLNRHNPTIATYLIERPSSLQNPLNLNALNARIAFAFIGYQDGDLKNDPRYVKWLVRHSGKKNGERYERILSYHACTEDDFAEFYPIAQSQESNLENKKDSLHCIDWDDANPFLVYG